MKHSHSFSLKWGVFTTVVLCWVVPILIIVSVAGFLLNTNYEKHLRMTVEADTAHAMDQVELRMLSALDASKAASYDGEIRNAYRVYQGDGVRVQLYRTVNDYLSRSYSRDENFKAVFVTFLDQPDVDYSYVISKGDNSYKLLREYRDNARAGVLEAAHAMDTGIQFLELDGELYMVRNLMDSKLRPYAVLTMLCDTQVLFQSLTAITSLTASQITVDDTALPLAIPETTAHSIDDLQVLTEFSTEVGGHALTFKAQAVEKNLWGAMPSLRWAVGLIVLLVFPLLAVIFYAFYRHVTHPLETLVNAANQVQAGQRGYTIDEMPHSQEFQKLTRHFNSMSTELKSQFDQIYLEQQALQEARIKALQSQINPHFLGNTLEIINWEARLAEDDKVSAMIEALSTMLDAAIGRDGRSQISLREELTYVDAYLYIIQQRLGDGLTVKKEIDERLLDQPIPRLLLQPLAENAVEHDIAQRHGSELCIRAYAKEQLCYLEVEHEGTISEEDRANIKRLLAPPVEGSAQKGHVGIRNLNQRLKLIYREQGALSIEEVSPGRILARVQLPLADQPENS